MNSLEATAAVIDALEQSEIPYMLVGAFSSNAYGISRSTKDADFVVTLQPGHLQELTELLGPDFLLDRQLQFEAITGSTKNCIKYMPTEFEIELFRLSNDAHHLERFSRRQRVQLGDLDRRPWLPTAEDVIIQKLRWQRRKDVDDAINVMAVRAGELNWDYIIRWTTEHSTVDLLNELRESIPKV